MNRSKISVVLAMGLLSHGVVHPATSQARSPLSFLERGSLHYPLDPIECTWWFDQIDHNRSENALWSFNSFKGLYGRSATRSFADKCDPKPSTDTCKSKSNKVTHKTVSLSTLWFGKEAFRGEEVFAGGQLMNDPCQAALAAKENVYLGFSRITPRFEYNEFGAYFGGQAQRLLGRNNQWRVGARASIPIKVINIEQDQSCKQLYETVDDVVRMRSIDNQAAADQFDFAARFDFLTSLHYFSTVNGSLDCIPFVTYQTPPTVPVVQMANLGVSGNLAGDPGVLVFAIGRPDGSVPDQPFRKTVADNTIGELAADGKLGNNAIAFFKDGTDYGDNIGLDRDTQQTLFIVPKAAPNNDSLAGQANAVSQQLLARVLEVNALGVESPLEFFRQSCDIDLCAAERITGQGDIAVEVYGGYAQKNWFADGIVGLSLPSGTKTDKVNRVFAQSTGNNGHVEIKLGVDGGWRVCPWFAFELDAAFHHAFKRTEQRAAPYKGATVHNIGPKVGVDISWNYVTAHVNFNFFHPYNPELGCMFGYDLFAKQKDKACTKCPAPVDCLGRENSSLPTDIQGLTPSSLEINTNSMTHKLRGEFFHRWHFCEIFAGAAQVIAGRNAMKESEAYMGITVYF